MLKLKDTKLKINNGIRVSHFNLACSKASSSRGEKGRQCSPVYGAERNQRLERRRFWERRRRFWDRRFGPALTFSTVFAKTERNVENLRWEWLPYELRSMSQLARVQPCVGPTQLALAHYF